MITRPHVGPFSGRGTPDSGWQRTAARTGTTLSGLTPRQADLLATNRLGAYGPGVVAYQPIPTSP